jgi:hypothetical protein
MAYTHELLVFLGAVTLSGGRLFSNIEGAPAAWNYSLRHGAKIRAPAGAPPCG